MDHEGPEKLNRRFLPGFRISRLVSGGGAVGLLMAVAIPASGHAQEASADTNPATSLTGETGEMVDGETGEVLDWEELFGNNAAARNKHYCMIVLQTDGTLHASPDNLVLTSTAFGARHASAQVIATNSRYRMSIDKPQGFTSAPPNGNSGVVFQSSYSGQGATNFSQTPGETQIKVKRGTTDVEIDLTATRASNPFPSGHYSAVLTMRCE